jgi:hypothetical protein
LLADDGSLWIRTESQLSTAGFEYNNCPRYFNSLTFKQLRSPRSIRSIVNMSARLGRRKSIQSAAIFGNVVAVDAVVVAAAAIVTIYAVVQSFQYAYRPIIQYNNKAVKLNRLIRIECLDYYHRRRRRLCQ